MADMGMEREKLQTEEVRRNKPREGMQADGVEIRHGICDICCPSFHCGLDAYVKEGKIIRIEGMKEHPASHGSLCTKGRMNRRYIYREDRLKAPLKRVGPRGGGQFEEISWEQAYEEIAEKLLKIRDESGPEAVMFYSGYTKWYRPFLHRLANSFGTPNYGTESSNCMFSTFLNWLVTTGNIMCRSDTGQSGVFLGWAFNPYYSRDLAAAAVEKGKARGMKVIVVDPRITPASERLADIHLRPRVGTDGSLAWGLAHVLIREGMTDAEYISRYVYGYEEYKRYAARFTPQETERLTGVPAADVVRAARMIGENLPLSICESAAPIAHHRNGFQNYRAIMALSAITGSFDRPGGQIPVSFSYNYQAAGLDIEEDEFIRGCRPDDMAPAVGSGRFPLWSEFIDEAQTNGLIQQLESGEPYPIRAIMGFGLNYRIGPADERLKRAMMQADLLVNTELFMTNTCRFCDYILPVCSSLERSELKVWGGGCIWYTRPVIKPLYKSRPDVEIICELARRLKLDDPLLAAGPEACYRYLIRRLPVTLEDLWQADGPVCLPHAQYIPGTLLEKGLATKSGRFELYSLAIEKYREMGLKPLPEYEAPAARADFPFRLCSSPRLPGHLHSRLRGVPLSRALHPYPEAQINPEDAGKLGVKEGDALQISTENGSICVRAQVSVQADRGCVYVGHGFAEADVNSLLGAEEVDPYSGFPAFRSAAVQVRKTPGGEKAEGDTGKTAGEGNKKAAGVFHGPLTMGQLVCETEKCVGCQACVAACMEEKDRRPERGEKSFCRVVRGEEEDRISWRFETCRHCGEAACEKACPRGCFHRDERTGLVTCDASSCIGCGACERACPYGAISMDAGAADRTAAQAADAPSMETQLPGRDADRKKARKCDGCLDRQKRGEEPACAAACERGALHWIPLKTEGGI